MERQEEQDREPGKHTWKVKCCCLLVIIIVYSAVGLVALEFILELLCVYGLNESNAECQFQVHSLNEFATVVEVLEPIVSMIIVIPVIFLYFCKTGCRLGCGCQCVKGCLGSIFKYNWFMKRFLVVIFLVAYFIFIFWVDSLYFKHRPERYLALPCGLVAWFVLQVVSNEKGPLTVVYRDTKPSCWLGFLSFVVFFFASLTNIVEFVIVTVYITKTLWTIYSENLYDEIFLIEGVTTSVPSDGDTGTINVSNLANVVDILGMTSTIALRYHFACFFWDMMFLSGKAEDLEYGGRYKLLCDPWEEWPRRHARFSNRQNTAEHCNVTSRQTGHQNDTDNQQAHFIDIDHSRDPTVSWKRGSSSTDSEIQVVTSRGSHVDYGSMNSV
ncbi:uncharacterized protein LOC144435728 [Glandiceps talaboti]